MTTFSNMDEIEAYLGQPRIRCLICGRSFESLATHLWMGHKVHAREYRIEHGIPLGRGLVAAGLHEVLSEAGKTHIDTLAANPYDRSLGFAPREVPTCEAIKNKLRANSKAAGHAAGLASAKRAKLARTPDELARRASHKKMMMKAYEQKPERLAARRIRDQIRRQRKRTQSRLAKIDGK